MSQRPQSSRDRRLQGIKNVLKKAGYIHASKIANTLQGSVWRASLWSRPSQKVVIKVTDKKLHSKSITIVNGHQHLISENIVLEMNIQKYLTANNKNDECESPDSIVKYYGSFQSEKDIYFVMEDGGEGLFDFVARAHQLIQVGAIEISEWLKVVKVIFKQMIEAIEYIHSKNVCHFDISLENFLINDVDVIIHRAKGKGDKVSFCLDDIHVKLCDFGLAGIFGKKSSFKSNKYVGKRPYKSPEIIAQKKKFNAKKNDIWCLGICLFMMIIGGQPWKEANKKNEAFNLVISNQETGLIELLDSWGVLHHTDKHLLQLFHRIFKYENKRCDLSDIKESLFLS